VRSSRSNDFTKLQIGDADRCHIKYPKLKLTMQHCSRLLSVVGVGAISGVKFQASATQPGLAIKSSYANTNIEVK